jgi:hypothetical protein
MKAIIKSIPVTSVTEGMQIVRTTNNQVLIIERIDSDENGIPFVQFKGFGGSCAPLSQLKTIVVEYDYIDDIDVYKTQLPLKHSDWQQAIDDGLVDSGKEVEAETVYNEERIVNGIDIGDYSAQLVPQQKRMYNIHQLRLAIGLGYIAGLKNLNPLAIPIEVENEIINGLQP